MKRSALLVICVSFGVSAFGQLINPSDKYTDAYRTYLGAKAPISKDAIKNYAYFSRDRELVHDHPFLRNARFEGAQIMYSWAQLEPLKDKYDFTIIEEDYKYLLSFGKRLFIQLQDATFSIEYKGIPPYLMTDEYDGGAICQRSDTGEPEGWVAKRWNKNVQKRFEKLLNELGKILDGKIEGINLQESAIGVTSKYDDSFTPALYVESLKENMLSLKKAFPKSTTIQYANFMPDEWLPWDEKGYLRSIYEYGEKIGVGLGAPDLMVQRKGQLNHALTMMHEHSYTVPLGIAVQDGNYIGQTNSSEVKHNRTNIVPLLYAFAKDFLKIKYIFWSIQEPYFTEDVLASFSK